MRRVCLRVVDTFRNRFPKLLTFRDHVRALVTAAQLQNVAMEVIAPSGRRSRFSAAELRGRVGKGRDAPRPEDVWRTIFSACFRAVEGDLLDQTVGRFRELAPSGRVVLPLYDGIIAAAARGHEQEVAEALERAGSEAASALGIASLNSPVVKGRA